MWRVLCGGGGGGGGRGAKPRVGGCTSGVGRCVYRGLGEDFAKMQHFRPSENVAKILRQHLVVVEYVPTRYCFGVGNQYAECEERKRKRKRERKQKQKQEQKPKPKRKEEDRYLRTNCER